MTIESKVQKLIAQKIPEIDIEDVVLDASLIDDLGADSLTIVELVMTMEEEFDIEVNDTDVEKLVTVGDVINFIQEKS